MGLQYNSCLTNGFSLLDSEPCKVKHSFKVVIDAYVTLLLYIRMAIDLLSICESHRTGFRSTIFRSCLVLHAYEVSNHKSKEHLLELDIIWVEFLNLGTLLDGEPIIDLPPKTIELKKVEFSKEERDFYCRLEADSRAQFAVCFSLLSYLLSNKDIRLI